MMRPFRDWSIKSKLILIIMTAGGIAVLTASLLFVLNDALKYRDESRQELRALADIIGNSSTAAVMFHDRHAARETIAALRANPRILSAYIITKDNELLASYVGAGVERSRLIIAGGGTGEPVKLEADALANLTADADSFWSWDYVVQPILLDNDRIGMVVLQSDSNDLLARIKWFMSVILMVGIAVFFFVYLLSSRLQSLISTPIVHLSETVKLVVDRKTYSVRAQKQGNDEVGVLIDGFNEMLAQIQARNDEVETYRSYLETEVSKRTIASNEWRMTFDSTKDAILMLDENDGVVKTNKSTTLYLNRPYSDILGRSVFQVFAASGFPSEIRPLALARQTQRHEEEEIFVPGRDLWFLVSADPIIAAEDRGNGAVLILRDITDRRRAEDSQKELQGQLIQVQKMDSIGRLAGGIAHDFNNILSAIIGFSYVALTKLPEDHPAAESVRIISESGERAAALTRQLLAFSRKQVLEMKVVNLNNVIEGMVKMLKRVIGENITLELKLQTKLGNILADTGQMEQVLMNLVVNARDAMPSGGLISLETKELRLDEGHGSAPETFAALSVADTGMGMSVEVQDRIFEPFFTTKGMGKGTGLGLSTVYGIVKQHGGHISVQSEEGKGTSFLVFFPIVDRELEKPAGRRHAAVSGGTETVLVVDDEPAIRKLLVQVLQPLGYRLLQASSGEEALKVGDEHAGPIDLLVTDVVMQGMNGAQLSEVLRRRRPRTKVIFISGYTDSAIITEDLIGTGMAFLQKPIAPFMLTNKVREVLDAREETAPRVFAPEDLTGMRILHADDDEANRSLVRNYLERFACVLDACENGRTAVEKFKAGSYDLVLMDMQMPVMDGLAATREIRSWEAQRKLPATPVVALTGSGAPQDVQAFLDAGCTAQLTKPFKRESLLAVVSAHARVRGGAPAGGGASGPGRITVRVDASLQDLIPGYLQGRREDVEKLRRALETRDYESLRILGHSMRGSGGGYGFDGITELGKRIELAAVKQDRGELQEGIAGLAQYLDTVSISYG